MVSVLLPLLFLAGHSVASLSPRSLHVPHEKRAADPHASGWQLARRLEPGTVIPLRVGLQQRNLDQLEDLLMSVSHPESTTYGQHWSPAQVVDAFAPSDGTVAAVKNWLIDAGLARDRLRLSPSRGWIAVNVTAAEAEELLHTEYHVYTHPSGAEQFGCHSYSVPAHVQEHVDLIKPTIQFNHHVRSPKFGKRSITPLSTNIKSTIKTNGVKVNTKPDLDTCDEIITPDCLRALYNFHHTPTQTKRNTFGIVEFTPQAFLESDLDMFFANFSPSQVGARPIPVLIDGAIVQTIDQSFDLNGESDLDLEYGMALTNPQPVQLLQTGDIVEGAGFDNWLDAVDGTFCTFEGGDDPDQDGIYPDPLPGGFKGPESCGIIRPPHTVSISYSQDEATITARSANRQCKLLPSFSVACITPYAVGNEYGKLGMLGTSRLLMRTTVQAVPNGKVFNPGFPSTCPFVTSVGATQIVAGNTVNDPETACEEVIFSGGGFSNIFPLPKYQAGAVKEFLRDHPPPFTDGQFNNSGNVRAFPDLSANGANYIIGIDGLFGLVFGTSCSAPTTASIFTMINDARIALGKGPVGFINPAIYSEPFKFAFNDITVGGNQGCGTTTGWDPVTGVGTPNFERLLLLFLLLP
ncbi:subtilisin-like protein [Mycena pura]|uniref:Subtilisin-like protein n=1 Tax=Mycena pura TaxID=153505 RepID=A0AAD6V1X4_9AGAR|nr:subtilisin-like protein [Mycena pura]